MPIDYAVDEDQGLLVTTVSGVVTDAETVSYMRRLTADPRYRKGMDGLVLTEGIERLEVTGAAVGEAVEIARRHEERFRGSRWAIVASRDPVFGVARMYELRRSPESYVLRVFREAEPAIAWLGSRRAEASEASGGWAKG